MARCALAVSILELLRLPPCADASPLLRPVTTDGRLGGGRGAGEEIPSEEGEENIWGIEIFTDGLSEAKGEERDRTSGWLSGADICVLALYATYAMLCVAYEWYCPVEIVPHTRSASWDVVKFLLILVVVVGHTQAYVVDGTYLGSKEDRWVHTWKMPAFVFVSGAFGSGVSSESILRMLCYTFGTDTILRFMCILLRGSHFWTWNGPWYLVALGLWRLAISPIFAAFPLSPKTAPGLRWAHQVGPLTLVYVVSYIGRHYEVGHHGHYNCLRTGKIWGYSMFFAIGLLLPPKSWSALLIRWNAVCAIIVILWYAGLVLAPDFDTVGATCLGHSPCSPAGLDLWYHGQVSPSGVILDLVTYTCVSLVAVSVVGLLLTMATLLEQRAPWTASCVAGWGSRTLYAYVLQTVLIDKKAFGILGFNDAFSPLFARVPASLRLPAVWLSVALLVAVTSCRMTERLLWWAVMPTWLVENPCCNSLRACDAGSSSTTGSDGENQALVQRC